MKVFITGVGSGLGEALARLYLKESHQVYGISRFLPKSLEGFENLRFRSLNLHFLEKIEGVMRELLGEESIDIAILNAGVVGEIKDMSDTSLSEIESIMRLNVWANKVILDYFKHHPPKQIVAISSGASVSGARGWNGYALSKATLNMLIKLYAAEMPSTHLISLAPGLIETPMMEYILKSADQEKFLVVKRLANSQRLDPVDAAKALMKSFTKLQKFESGSYVDIRKL